jgi:hypothetical protein
LILTREQRLDMLTAACHRAGVALGTFDLAVVGWLANYEDASCAVVAGLISRAHAGVTLTPEQTETVLDALHDAKWSHVIIGCADCDAVEMATTGESIACERHKPDEEKADRFDALMVALGGKN